MYAYIYRTYVTGALQVYIIKWEGGDEERKVKWDAFINDPEWIEKRAQTELPENGGNIVEVILETDLVSIAGLPGL